MHRFIVALKPLILSSIVLSIFSGKLLGHPLDVGYLWVKGETLQKFHARFELNPAMLEGISIVESFQHSIPKVSEAACQIENLSSKSKTKDQTDIEFDIQCPGAEGENLDWPLEFLSKMPSAFQLFANLEIGGSQWYGTLDSKSLGISAVLSQPMGWKHFIEMGAEHIGAMPNQWKSEEGDLQLPDGIDHILFLIALFLGAASFGQLLIAATGFTIGHSITLAIGAFQILSLPSWFTESAIAFTIFWMGLSVARGSRKKTQWPMTSLFGLVHGLGLATFLIELKLSSMNLVKALLGFNLGVELGQIALLSIFFILFLPLAKIPSIRLRLVQVGSILIAIAGFYWLIQRSFGHFLGW